jgi:hypothetical protein
MYGQPPAFRFLTRDEGSEKLTEIGAAWATSKADVFSVSLDPESTGEKIKLLMVTNRPKPKAQPAKGEAPSA